MTIDEYLAYLRKLHGDEYVRTVEAAIRWALSSSTTITDISAAIERGQLEIATEANQGTPESQNDTRRTEAPEQQRINPVDDWQARDARANYELALEIIRRE